MADKINATAVNEDELFTFVSNDDLESEKIIAPRYSYWKSVFRVFFRKKTNWFVLGLLALLLLSCFLVPVFCKYDPYENVTNAYMYNKSPVAPISSASSDWARPRMAMSNSSNSSWMFSN